MNESLPMNIATWIGIGFCITQSAMFSGLNLAVFGISRLRLEVKALTGDQDASKVLELRKDSNFLLSTILWGNSGKPRFVLDSDGFIRGALFKGLLFNPYTYCHKPIIVNDINLSLEKVIWKLKVYPQNSDDDVIDHDIILLWSTEKRVIFQKSSHR